MIGVEVIAPNGQSERLGSRRRVDALFNGRNGHFVEVRSTDRRVADVVAAVGPGRGPMSASTDDTSAQWCWLMLDTMRSNDSSG